MRAYQAHPEDQLAFILNLSNHWFCIRSFGTTEPTWFNLNSFIEPAYVGSAFLGALLDQSTREGYSVFVVRPTSEDFEQSQLIISQFRASPADQVANGGSSSGGFGGSSEDEELERAIAASLASNGHSSPLPAIGQASSSASPSAGRRRKSKSKRQGDEDLQTAVAASLKAQGSSKSGSASAGASGSNGLRLPTGRSRDTAIELPGSDEEDQAPVAGPSRSPFLNPSLRDQLIEGIDVDDEDGFVALPSATTTSRQATTRPSGGLSQPIEIGSDDDEDKGNFDESWHQTASAFQNMRDRDYDDEDAELQRALAASMGDTSVLPTGSGGITSNQTGGEDAYGDPEEQARILAQIVASRQSGGGGSGAGRRSPTPADVGKIAKMREEARRKEREDREREERHARGEYTPEPQAPKVAGDSEDEDEEEQEEEKPEDKPMSPEEIRRMRLARFGGA